MLALALKMEQMLQDGVVKNYSDLAQRGRVSAARITQVMNLLHLAPDIQEALLFLPLTERGRDRIILADLQPLAAMRDWRKQRRRWAAFTGVRRRL